MFQPATPVVYVIGSLEKAMYSKGLFDEVEADVHLGIARAAANVDAIVVDNGLQTSTGALCGEVRTLPVYSVGVTGAFSHLVWQIQTADLHDPHNLAERFRSNAKVGGIVFASILAGKLAVPLVG